MTAAEVSDNNVNNYSEASSKSHASLNLAERDIPQTPKYRGKPHNPLRIALLGYRSHPFVGGQGIYIKYLSRALSQLGHSVDVYSGPPYPDVDDNVQLIKVPSLDLYAVDKPFRALTLKHCLSWTDFHEWWSKVSGLFGEPQAFGRRAHKLLKHSDYDIIHDNQSLSYGLLRLIKQKHNLVATIHHPIHRDRELAIQAEQGRLMRMLKKRWYSFLTMQEQVVNKLEHIITVSETSKSDIVSAFDVNPNKVTVIGNGVDTSVFRPQPDIQRDSFRLITTSSSDQPLKGLPVLLEAIANLKTQFPELHLEIIGTLKSGGATEQKLAQLGLTHHVTFSSGISTEELVEKYARATIAVCPSLYEGFGLPLIEAMACGIPVVTSDGGALKEVAGDAAHIFAAGDSQHLTEQLNTLLRDQAKQRQFSKKSRDHVLKHYCWNNVAERLTHYYSEILASANH